PTFCLGTNRNLACSQRRCFRHGPSQRHQTGARSVLGSFAQRSQKTDDAARQRRQTNRRNEQSHPKSRNRKRERLQGSVMTFSGDNSYIERVRSEAAAIETAEGFILNWAAIITEIADGLHDELKRDDVIFDTSTGVVT